MEKEVWVHTWSPSGVVYSDPGKFWLEECACHSCKIIYHSKLYTRPPAVYVAQAEIP